MTFPCKLSNLLLHHRVVFELHTSLFETSTQNDSQLPPPASNSTAPCSQSDISQLITWKHCCGQKQRLLPTWQLCWLSQPSGGFEMNSTHTRTHSFLIKLGIYSDDSYLQYRTCVVTLFWKARCLKLSRGRPLISCMTTGWWEVSRFMMGASEVSQMNRVNVSDGNVAFFSMHKIVSVIDVTKNRCRVGSHQKQTFKKESETLVVLREGP